MSYYLRFCLRALLFGFIVTIAMWLLGVAATWETYTLLFVVLMAEIFIDAAIPL